MATVVTAKVIHIGEDYALISLSTVGNEPKKFEEIVVSKAVGEWLEEVGAYDK